jgi:hypothetical protein
MQSKISQYVMYALMLIGVIALLMVNAESYDAILYVTYGYCFICVLAAIGASVAGIAANPKQVKGVLIGVVSVAVVFGVSYALATDEVLPNYGEGITPSTSRLSGMGLYAFYILFFGAILSILYSSVARFFK